MKKTLKRRRKENKTDYGKRIKFLKSNMPRIVFRKSNKFLIAQYVESREAQDKILIGINSKLLLKYGWQKDSIGSLKSLPAAYLLGYLMGKKIISSKFKTPIIDFGMYQVSSKNKLQAFLKGLVDVGIKIKVKKENFPEDERIKGKHMKKKINFDEIKTKIEKEK